MKEILFIHVGQAGIQTGQLCWELFCREHGINFDGGYDENNNLKDDSSEILFSSLPNGNVVPRSVFVDLDPMTIHRVRTGSQRQLFHQDKFIAGKESAADNHHRGHYTIGKEVVDEALNQIRLTVNDCETLQGFVTTMAVGGGTGSGLGSLLLERISVDYGKKPKIGHIIYPSPNICGSIVESYNCVLTSKTLQEHQDLTVLYDNEAMYRVCEKKIGITAPEYCHLNMLIAQTISSTISPTRFGGDLNSNLQEMVTNLVPFPKLNFTYSSFSPFPKSFGSENNLVTTITNELFDSSSPMFSVDPNQERHSYKCACINYRGEEVHPSDIFKAFHEVRISSRFEEYSPAGLKAGVTSRKPVLFKNLHDDDYEQNTKVTGSMIANNSSICDALKRIDKKFDLMYSKRAFVHWYAGEGLSEGEFRWSREEFDQLEKDYEWFKTGGEDELGSDYDEEL